MSWVLTGLGVAIVGVSLLGGFLPLATVLTHTRLQIYLSLAAGTMLGAAFFHMLPEAVELGSTDVLGTAAIGLLALFFLERFFSFHHHESADESRQTEKPHGDPSRHHAEYLHDHDADEGQEHPHPQARSLHWGAAAFGLAVHTLISGIALASAVAADLAQSGKLGAGTLGVFLASLFHKPADALTIVSLMLRDGVSRPVTHLVNFCFSLMVPLGMLVFWFRFSRLPAGASLTLTAHALAFSAGTFLCIALSDLLPELQFHTHDRVKLSLSLLVGFLIMVATAWWEGTSAKGHGPGPEPAHPVHPE